MSCPFCAKKVHPDALLDLGENHRQIHEYWNMSFVLAVCPSDGRRNTLRTTNKYGSQLGFFVDDAYRALHDKKKRQSNTSTVYRLVRHLLEVGKIGRETNVLALITGKSFLDYLARARVDRYKNKRSETFALWHTLEFASSKSSNRRMAESSLSRTVDSKNTIRSPLTHYNRIRAKMANLSGINKELVLFPGLLAKNPGCKQLAALRQATGCNLLVAAYNRKREREGETKPRSKRARITGLVNMPEYNDVECVVSVQGLVCVCVLPSGDVVDVPSANLVF